MPKGIPLDLTAGEKLCPRCQRLKPLSEFHKSKHNVHGYQSHCKECSRQRHDKWRRQNLKRMAKASKKWRTENPRLAKDHGLRTRYGIPFGTYDAMLAAQDGKCAICQRTDAGKRGDFHVDHCHSSKQIRGLLCHGCNVSIGHFKHDPKLLTAAIRYLTERS